MKHAPTRPTSIEGKLQILAATTLLERSRLVRWHETEHEFIPVARDAFELSVRTDVDPTFGRFACWILFAAGAELLAKGACLIQGIEIRNPNGTQVYGYPTEPLSEWIQRFRKADCPMSPATDFGTLESVTPKLKLLCEKMDASHEDAEKVLAAYEFLRRTIRNRDAHAYVPNERDAHFWLVPKLFTNCFNVLIGSIPEGNGTLTSWRADADSFVKSLTSAQFS